MSSLVLGFTKLITSFFDISNSLVISKEMSLKQKCFAVFYDNYRVQLFLLVSFEATSGLYLMLYKNGAI